MAAPDMITKYLRCCREEVARRLVDRVYLHNTAVPCKHWLAYGQRVFLNKVLN